MANYSYHHSENHRKFRRVVHKARTFHLKYQNTLMLLFSLAMTYLLVKAGLVKDFADYLTGFGYASAVILGFFFALGFTTPIASATLIFLARNMNPFPMALLGAMGATIANLLIYLFVRHKLLDEIRYILNEDLKLEFSKFEIKLSYSMTKKWWVKILVPALAGFLTALPVPTEFFAAMLWNIVRYRIERILFFAFIFSFFGILALGLFGISLH